MGDSPLSDGGLDSSSSMWHTFDALLGKGILSLSSWSILITSWLPGASFSLVFVALLLLLPVAHSLDPPLSAIQSPHSAGFKTKNSFPRLWSLHTITTAFSSLSDPIINQVLRTFQLVVLFQYRAGCWVGKGFATTINRASSWGAPRSFRSQRYAMPAPRSLVRLEC